MMDELYPPAVVHDADAAAVAALCELEVVADGQESDASDTRWEQAEHVVELLGRGWTRRAVADVWKRPDGTTYSQPHVTYVAKTWNAFGHLGDTDRPRWNDAYHSPEVRSSRKPAGTLKPPPPLTGRYRVILADPPWDYEFAETKNRAIEGLYPTMTFEQLAALDVPADDHALLLMWATAPKLDLAVALVAAWGFEFVTSAVWVKDKIGMGYWFRQQHELVLVARRGTFSPPPVESRPSSIIAAPRTDHSAKPDALHEYVEAWMPADPETHLEMFARKARHGWTAWGNQL